MPTTPELISPNDGITSRLGSMVFKWEAVDGGGDYILEIALDSAFAQLVSQLQTTLTEMEAVFPSGAFYYWRVRIAAVTSSTFRGFSSPPFSPVEVATHTADGKARLLNQFLGVT